MTRKLSSCVVLLSLAACDADHKPTAAPDTTIEAVPAATRHAALELRFGSDDASATFMCRIDGIGDFTPCASPHSVTVADGDHVFEVAAVNVLGPDPSPARVAWLVDTLAPNVSIGPDPAEGSVTGAMVSFAFFADEEVTGFQCSLNGAAFAACPPSFGPLPTGPYQLAVHATDEVGNVGPDAIRGWTVDTSGPQVNISVVGSLRKGVAAFTLTPSEPVQSMSCVLDGGAPAVCTSGSISYSELTAGSHSFKASAVDQKGNAGAPQVMNFTEVLGDGHIALLGHDFATVTTDSQDLLLRALSLAPAASFTREVRVATFAGASVNATEAQHVDEVVAKGARVKVTRFGPGDKLTSSLQGMDVLLVYDQQDPSLVVDKLWPSALSAFLKTGGVVIVCDGAVTVLKATTPSQTYRILGTLLAIPDATVLPVGSNAGLLTASSHDPLAGASAYKTMSSTVGFSAPSNTANLVPVYENVNTDSIKVTFVVLHKVFPN